MAWIRTNGAPLARTASARAAHHMQHRTLVPDQQPEQLDERRGIERARGPVGRRLNRDRIADARHGQALLAPEIGAEHNASRAPGRPVPEQSRRPLHGQARNARHAPHRAPGGAAAGVGKHEIRVRTAPHQAQ